MTETMTAPEPQLDGSCADCGQAMTGRQIGRITTISREPICQECCDRLDDLISDFEV
jgi:hypothetical protein